MRTDLNVYGFPAPQGSKRPVRLRDGRTVLIESSKAVKPWRDAVVQACVSPQVDCITDPVSVVIAFLMPRPKSHYKADGALREAAPDWHMSTPDIDKLVRSTLDALVIGQALRDDSLVVHLNATKHYADGSPGASISITTLERN